MSFDRSDFKNIGRPLYWDLKNTIAFIEDLIKSDEIMMALDALKMVPAWYREPENYPKELIEIRKTLYKNLYSPIDYASDFDEANWVKEDAENQWLSPYTFPRAEILMKELKRLNDQGVTPWIGELSTSHGALPLGLAKHGVKFNFYAQNLNQKALDKVISWLPEGVWQEKPRDDQYKIFVFTEALEHCYREDDLWQMYTKINVDFDMILLSTPYGCLGHGLPNYKDRRLGHVRGYTRGEFLEIATGYFPGFLWEHYMAASQVLVGKKQ